VISWRLASPCAAVRKRIVGNHEAIAGEPALGATRLERGIEPAEVRDDAMTALAILRAAALNQPQVPAPPLTA